MQNDRIFYIGVLKSNECQCGREKKPHMALCYQCFKRLPQYMQSELYLKMGEGFEETYDNSVIWLNS